MSALGATMFARFAFPPNLEGYCGPAEPDLLFAYGAGLQSPDPGLDTLARAFEGAWPYLELLNASAPVDDPLSEQVVEAYWIGNPLLARVDAGNLGNHLADRFGPRSGRAIDIITAGVGAGAVPNHAFHVFGVYPWLGLLRDGIGGTEPLRVLDRCRIRWGFVLDTDGELAIVRSRPLTWTGASLSLGAPIVEKAECGEGGGLAGILTRGDMVALHWDWVCQRLSSQQLGWLERVTRSQLEVINRTSGQHDEARSPIDRGSSNR